ncbi:hypothetical protein [Actinomyces lilanjuaniae]|uniref:hypothetical protein n=1 Tax=Actinomyces lilanjuaniae TaxID=2321394 RepID=UPI0013C496C8|nr:hypothetical protein [Actinomyces lilanjuaniae]
MTHPTPPGSPSPSGLPPYTASQPSPAAASPRRRRRLWIPVTLVAVLVLGAVAAGGIYLATRTPSVPATEAQADQCIDSPSNEKPVVVDCDSEDAVYRVVANLWSEGMTDCVDAPGTEAVFEKLCLIPKDNDPEQALSTVEEGGCLTIDDIEADSPDATKSDCVPGAYPVQAVLHHIDQFSLATAGITTEHPCAEAGVESGSSFAWSFNHYTMFGISQTDYDFVFCLGEPQD